MVILASDMPPYMDSDESDHESFIEVTDLSCAKPRILMKKASLGSEKQISVDPISLRESSNSQLVRHPITASPKKVDVLIPLPPPKNKLLSQSLPNSASSSPRFGSHMSKRKCKNQSQPSSSLSVMYRHNSVALANLERLREIHLGRSKSCGEGRASAPPEDFDLYWLTSTKADDHVKHENNQNNTIGNGNYYKTHEAADENSKPREENTDTSDEIFKCKALCLYLPAFSKAKPVLKARRQGSDMSSQVKEEALSAHETGHVVSKRVSLEKFDCGSWNSINVDDTEDEGDGDASNLFFDLPLELIRCNANDTHSPVTTAFVFDKEPKGVLKHSTSKSAPRKSCESVRHVRFSTTSNPASPTSCITPRLRKARDDFNAFLEAQSV